MRKSFDANPKNVPSIVHQEIVEALRRREEVFSLLVASIKDYAIFMLDPKGNVTTWNEGARRIKGYEADEIIGKG